MIRREKAFTLVELLVVIAIVGIVLTIVLVYLSDARGKGNDTKVRSLLTSARSSAEVFYTSYNTYNGAAGNISGDCTTANSMFTDSVSGMLKFTTLSNYPNTVELTCYSTGSAYAISATLPGEGGTNSWCVDSNNSSQARPTPINSPSC